ncbi:MAG: PcfJ domain-containing protein [Alphaproteobacteria bacterium]|nr:PcfJ domain-containing protein [Alphaproteobacteria bacterium]
MNAPIWSDLETSAFETLVGRCATVALRKSDSRIAALLALMALSHARLDADVHDNHLEADLRVHPAPPGHGPAAELLDHITCIVSDVARCARGETRLDISARLDDWGYAFLMVDLLGDGAREAELTAMAECVGAALTRVHKRVEELCTQHLRAVLTRDAPQAAFLSRGLTLQAEWLLAPYLSGDASRPDILVRRAQALGLFGSLVSALREPAITEVVDRAEPLTPALAGHLGLTEAELRAFRGSRDVRASIEQWDDFVVAARRLKTYSVPRHEWPGAAQPETPSAWQNSPWLRSPRTHLIRPDYLEEKEAGVQDAVLALKDDLIRPLVAARRPPGDLRNTTIAHFASELDFPQARHGCADYRTFLLGLHRAIIGTRKPKAFQEAAALWHRRAASLSALRHEHTAERPGWPALCAAWRSHDGRYEVVALTSASDLVIEGNAMQHCVGGYYDVCRRGDTQILSLRRDGHRAATVEIALEGSIEAPALKVGQFKAIRNTRPADDLHDALRDFLRDLRSQAHAMNAATLARYRRRMHKRGDYAWRSDALPLDHAREAYPLYRPLLPRPAPASFDLWCAESGLVDTIDRAFAALGGKSPASPR